MRHGLAERATSLLATVPESPEGRRQVGAGSARVHRGVNLLDIAIGVHIKSPSPGESHPAQHTESANCGLVVVRKYRKVCCVFFGEGGYLFEAVHAGHEIVDVEVFQNGATVTQRLAFQGSATGKYFREEGNHERLALERIRRVGVTVGTLHVELRCGIAHPELCLADHRQERQRQKKKQCQKLFHVKISL